MEMNSPVAKTIKKAGRSSQEDLTHAVKEKALSLGANLVGIAPMERMKGAPPDLHPRRLLPEAKSIVSMAYRINRAVQKLHLRNQPHALFTLCRSGTQGPTR